MLKLRFQRKYLAIPYAIFLVLFIILPILLIIYYAISDSSGNISFNNLIDFFKDKNKLGLLSFSVVVGIINTILCLIIGYPLSMLLVNKKYNKSKVMFLLFITPMWINFVLRTAATRDLLYWLGLNGGEHPYVATMIGMVYNYLPFTILPLYSTMLKMDKSLIEASYDLGARPHQTFFKTIIPMTLPGIVSAITMVFMPTMSSFVISDIMGERKISLIGNAIQFNFDQSRWNAGSLIALIMLVIILIIYLLTKNVQKEEDARGSLW